jgi:hypothetical protein
MRKSRRREEAAGSHERVKTNFDGGANWVNDFGRWIRTKGGQ